jgi:hypothetical protein
MSLSSQCTDNLSRLSIVFAFDSELLASKTYKRVLQSSFRAKPRWSKEDTETIQASERSKVIDRSLSEDTEYVKSEIKILLLGAPGGGKEFVINQLRLAFPGAYSEHELATRRFTIYLSLIKCAKSLIKALDKSRLHLELEVNRQHRKYLADFSLDPDPEKPLEARVAKAIHSIWQDPCIRKANGSLRKCYSRVPSLASVTCYRRNEHKLTNPQFL